MTKTEKILACHGNLIGRSTAIVCNCSESMVYNVWSQHLKPVIKKHKYSVKPKR